MDDFQPLGKNSIRLLRIQPELRNGHIACIVHQFDEVIPPYDALSYHWGDPKSERKKIYVNNSLVDIHKALWEFLNQMQRSQEVDSWIWTDFLCLNQRSHTEMGHQVPRMGHIYSNAERTLSWLGCNDSSWVPRPDSSPTPSHDFEDDMRLIAESVKVRGAAVRTFFAQPNMVRWTDFTKLMLRADHAVDDMNPIRWDQYVKRKTLLSATRQVMRLSRGFIAQRILNILSLPYWTRAWIIQEVALAKEVKLIFGEASLDLNDFILIYKSYCHYILKTFGPGSVKLSVPIEARAAVYENNISFQQILLWGQHCKASKTADRIYGLLGLLERTDTLPSILAQSIDYTKDWREVYWEIVLTYHPVKDPSIISGDGYSGLVKRWVKYLPNLGESLSCPFTSESLQYADNERATTLCRAKARIALDVVDICRQAAMTDIGTAIWLQSGFGPDACTPSWPTKPGARQLWSAKPDGDSSPVIRDIQLLLGTLLIETAEIEEIEETDKLQAAFIGWKMVRSESQEGGWNCVPHQSMGGLSEHNIKVSFDCKICVSSSQLPCSSLLTTLSASSLERSHQCRTLDRYLVIERTGWRLSLKDLQHVRGEEYWRGSLNIEY